MNKLLFATSIQEFIYQNQCVRESFNNFVTYLNKEKLIYNTEIVEKIITDTAIDVKLFFAHWVKCPRCQDKMLYRQNGWTCYSCGHWYSEPYMRYFICQQT